MASTLGQHGGCYSFFLLLLVKKRKQQDKKTPHLFPNRFDPYIEGKLDSGHLTLSGYWLVKSCWHGLLLALVTRTLTLRGVLTLRQLEPER